MALYTVPAIIAIILSGFIMEVIDATLGMGYGTVLTPVLLMVGFDPYQVVPAVLISQLIGDWGAVIFHQRFKNIDFLTEQKKALKIGLSIGFLSCFGAIIAVFVAVNVSKFLMSLYIGLMVHYTENGTLRTGTVPDVF